MSEQERCRAGCARGKQRDELDPTGQTTRDCFHCGGTGREPDPPPSTPQSEGEERCDGSGWIGGNVAPWPAGGPKKCPGCPNCRSDYEDGWLLAPDGTVVDGPRLPDHNIAVVPASRLQSLEAEKQAVLDAINLYGDETLHKALDDIGWPALAQSPPLGAEARLDQAEASLRSALTSVEDLIPDPDSAASQPDQGQG